MQYRCTRPEVYPEGTPGFTDRSARQGHYIYAENEKEAFKRMQERFPNETRFDIQPWGTLSHPNRRIS